MENNYIYLCISKIKEIAKDFNISYKYIIKKINDYNKRGELYMVKIIEEEGFKEKFNKFIPELTKALTIPNSPDWTVKGFIDYYRNIYSISIDTKVVSKIIELMIFPKFLEFAKINNYELKLSPHQNYYPDITFIDKATYEKYAIDLKSTYRKSSTTVNGMTLGAFTGYFRNRDSNKNTLYKYNEYKEHYVFGIIYSRTDITLIEDYFNKKNIKFNSKKRDIVIKYINEPSEEIWESFVSEFKEDIELNEDNRKEVDSFIISETEVYNLENFTNIKSVVMDFDFFIQEKWRIAIDRPGSGNTKNIGSENNISNLKEGNGLFVREFGEKAKEIFNNYWTIYETKDMAKSSHREEAFFTNISTYKEWLKTIKTF